MSQLKVLKLKYTFRVLLLEDNLRNYTIAKSNMNNLPHFKAAFLNLSIVAEHFQYFKMNAS